MVAIPFFGLIYQKVETLNRAIDMVGSLFDEQPVLSNESPFDITDYYEPEFGRDLKRRWCGFGESIPADQILNLKLKSINFEQELAENGKRTVNIDPGIIQLNRVVLATHKDAAHRIYLGQGIFVELILLYEKGTFRPLPWTYPDYQWPETIEFFNSLRNRLKEMADV